MPVTDDPRVRPRRRRGARARWLAARTANAARHALLIAGIGSIVMIAALFTFVLVPRRADRALTAALAALPPARDTVALLARRTEALAARDSALARLSTARAAAALATPLGAVRVDSLAPSTAATPASVAPGSPAPAMTAPGAGGVPSGGVAAAGATPPATPQALPLSQSAATSAANDSLLALQQQLARTQQAPLIESYRVMADLPLLRGESGVRATMDSMEMLHREREAYAALSGPDARYAAMTTRLTQLGQRLERIAEAVLSRRATLESPGAPMLMPPLMPDTMLDAARQRADVALQRADSAIAEARRANAALAVQQAALRERTQVFIPPVAMLLASLVLGLALGFAVVLWREMRRPTVGDADELEALVQTRVIVHEGDASRRHTLARAARIGTATVRRARASGGRRDDPIAPALQPLGDAWPLLHLALTGIGDPAHRVQVLADRSLLAGTVGLNLAAVAARESRATVLVDAAVHAGALVPLLPPASLRVRGGGGGSAAMGPWDTTRAVPLGRDASIDLVLPRRARQQSPATPRAIHGRGADVGEASVRTAAAGDASGDAGGVAGRGSGPTALIASELAAIATRYDLAVFVSDDASSPLLPADTDVVLCARLGVTPLAWLADAVRRVRAEGRSIRAVVLWADDLALAA